MSIIPEQTINDLELWVEGWVYDRTQQAEAKRRLLLWMDSVLGFETKEDTWSSSP